MRTTIKIIVTTTLLCIVFISRMCAQNQHWTCDIHAYQYDMTAYVAVEVNGHSLKSYSDYEIAAFCGNECRGVASIQTTQKDGKTGTYGYLRIRSNQQKGETITFKVYQKTMAQEIDVEKVEVSFKAQEAVGLPSNPLVLPLTIAMMGDANGDGHITTFDVTKVVNYILTGQDAGLNKLAVDMDGDGNITTLDVSQILQLILNK